MSAAEGGIRALVLTCFKPEHEFVASDPQRCRIHGAEFNVLQGVAKIRRKLVEWLNAAAYLPIADAPDPHVPFLPQYVRRAAIVRIHAENLHPEPASNATSVLGFPTRCSRLIP